MYQHYLTKFIFLENQQCTESKCTESKCNNNQQNLRKPTTKKLVKNMGQTSSSPQLLKTQSKLSATSSTLSSNPSSSSLSFLPESVLKNLQKFASEKSLTVQDPIWNSLSSLAIPVIFTQNDFVQIQNVCDELLDTTSRGVTQLKILDGQNPI